MSELTKSFSESAKELKSVKNIAVTGLLVAVSMAIEAFTINLPLFKINFAFLAISSIGALFGPAVGIIAGTCCDIVGYLASPGSTPFMPAYVFVAAFQGFIYGAALYHKNISSRGADIRISGEKSKGGSALYVRMAAARLADVVIINLVINTALNMHYGFIPKDSLSAALGARVVKNILELAADIPLMFIILPVVLTAYKKSEKLRVRH